MATIQNNFVNSRSSKGGSVFRLLWLLGGDWQQRSIVGVLRFSRDTVPGYPKEEGLLDSLGRLGGDRSSGQMRGLVATLLPRPGGSRRYRAVSKEVSGGQGKPRAPERWPESPGRGLDHDFLVGPRKGGPRRDPTLYISGISWFGLNFWESEDIL